MLLVIFRWLTDNLWISGRWVLGIEFGKSEKPFLSQWQLGRVYVWVFDFWNRIWKVRKSVAYVLFYFSCWRTMLLFGYAKLIFRLWILSSARSRRRTKRYPPKMFTWKLSRTASCRLRVAEALNFSLPKVCNITYIHLPIHNRLT